MAMSRGVPGVLRVALLFAALLAALAMVIWRQSRALEVLRALDSVGAERALAEAERAELLRRVQSLESRARVVAAARSRLGMHVPRADEIVILSSALPGDPMSSVQPIESQRLTDPGRGGEAELGGAAARHVVTRAGGVQ